MHLQLDEKEVDIVLNALQNAYRSESGKAGFHKKHNNFNLQEEHKAKSNIIKNIIIRTKATAFLNQTI